MNNTLEFILKLKDMMSGSMQKAASTAQSAMKQVENAVARTSRTTSRSIGDMNNRLDALRKTRELSVDLRQIRSAGREMDRLERQRDRLESRGRRGSAGGSGGGGGILGMLGSTRGLAAGLGIAAVVAGTGKVAGMGMEAGKTRTSFQVMAGQQAGGQLYNDVKKFAQDSIFGNELYKDAQTMKAFGIATNQVMPTLRMLGDISMGDKQRLESLTLAFSQSQAAGRLMGQDLLQMINAGFNPLQEMSKMTGKSMAKLREDMENGAISTAMVTKAFQHAVGPAGQFYQMTDKIAKTPFGKWEAMKGQIEGIALSLGESLMPVVSQVLSGIQPFIDMLPGVVTAMQPMIQVIGGALGQVIGLIPTAMDMLRPFVDVFNAWPIKQLITDFLSLAKTVMGVLTPVFAALKPAMVAFQQVVGGIAHTLMQAASGIIEKLSPAFTSIARIVGSVLTPILKIVGPIINGLLKGIGWVIEKIAPFINFIAKLIEKVAGGIGWVLDKISGAFDGMTKKAHLLMVATGGAAAAAGLKVYADLKSRAEAKGAVGASTGLGKMSMGSADVKDSASKVTGGGVRAVTINIGKLWEDLVFHVASTKEADQKIGDQTAEGLLRLFHSVGAVAGG